MPGARTTRSGTHTAVRARLARIHRRGPPESLDDGEPIVSNGLALCKLHHAAFDRHFLGIRPDFTVEVRPDLLRESDGPTLLHGIQGMHDTTILVPRRRDAQPDPERLHRRFQEFRERMKAS